MSILAFCKQKFKRIHILFSYFFLLCETFPSLLLEVVTTRKLATQANRYFISISISFSALVHSSSVLNCFFIFKLSIFSLPILFWQLLVFAKCIEHFM